MKYAQTAAYFLAFVALGMNMALLGPTINKLAGNVRVDLATISWLFTAFALGYLSGSLLSGKLYDKVSGAPLVGVALLLLGAINALMPTITSFAVLVVAQVLLGMMASAVDVGGNTLLVWAHGKSVGPFMNALHLMFGVGGFIAPYAVSYALTSQTGVPLAYWLLAALAAPIGLLNLIMRSPRAENVAAAAVQSGDVAGARVPDANRGYFLTLMVVLFFMIVAGEANMASWAFNYARAYGAGEPDAARLTSAFWGAFTVGRLIGIPIAARVSPGRILFANTLLCVLGTALMLVAASAATPMLAGVLIFGIGIGPLFATAIAFAEQNITLTGMANGLFLAGGSLSSMTIPLLIGRVFESVGAYMLPFVTLLVMTAAAGILALLFRAAGARSPVVVPSGA
jgi:FHS family Na+ dependent glucose MFS transporter 1